MHTSERQKRVNRDEQWDWRAVCKASTNTFWRNSDNVAEHSAGSVFYLFILFNVSGKRAGYFMDNKHTLVESLPVYCSAKQLKEESDGKDEKISVHEFWTPLEVDNLRSVSLQI